MARVELRVLHALDVARTQLYHFTAILIAGMGFFTDAYDLFSISLVSDLLGHIYYDGHPPDRVVAVINGIALCGAVPGQLIFGWLGDKMGRKRIYGVVLILMVVCSLASGLSFSKRKGKNIVTVLCFFRFWLGFSIGGDYPLSATIMSEYANKRTRGAFIATVFAMQGFGNLAVGIVANFGPNTTTFIIPAEIFPARLRSTCHGISGAFGKIGAIIGVFGFMYTKKHVRCILFALVGCNLVGFMFTLLLPETKRKSLEEITGEMVQEEPQDDPAAVAVAEDVHKVPL